MNLSSQKTLWLGAFFTFLLDQLTKILALNMLPYDQEVLINQYISFHRIFNNDTMMLSYKLPFGLTLDTFRLFWLSQALLLAAGIYWVVNKEALKNGGWIGEFSKVGLFFILGGLLGNAFDRIFRDDGVIDFIRLNFLTNSIPILNVADIMIYLGEINLVIAWLILFIKIIQQYLKNRIKINEATL